jgi:TolA-binding protein
MTDQNLHNNAMGGKQHVNNKNNNIRDYKEREKKEMEHQINHLQESILELQKTQITNAKVSIAETMKHNSKNNKKSDGNRPKHNKTTSSSTCNKVTKKKASNKKNDDDLDIEEHSDNESSVDDGVDYTKEKNYAVKKFIGHSEVKKREGKRNNTKNPMEGMER